MMGHIAFTIGIALWLAILLTSLFGFMEVFSFIPPQLWVSGFIAAIILKVVRR